MSSEGPMTMIIVRVANGYIVKPQDGMRDEDANKVHVFTDWGSCAKYVRLMTAWPAELAKIVDEESGL